MSGDPGWDFLGAIGTAAPGLIPTHDQVDAVLLAYRDAGYLPLSAAQIVAITGPPPAQPTVMLPIGGNPAHGMVATFAKGMKRLQDSNPAPHDGWSIDSPEKQRAG